MTIGLGASVISFYVMPWLYLNKTSLNNTLLLSLIAPCLSLLSVMVFIAIYRSQEKIDKTVRLINRDLEDRTPAIKQIGVVRNSTSNLAEGGGSLTSESKLEDQIALADPVNTENTAEQSAQVVKKPFNIKDLRNFPATFWCLAGMSFICLTTYYQFIGVATKLISIKYDLDYDQAKNVPPIVPLITIPLIPTLTRGVYTWGQKPVMMSVGCTIGIGAFLLMMLGNQLSPYFVCALVSLFSSCIYSGFWSSAAIASEGVHVDMGLAIINTVQNLGSFIMPIVVSTFIESIDKSNADSFLLLLIGLLLVSLLFSLALIYFDRKSGGRISAPEKNRQQITHNRN